MEIIFITGFIFNMLFIPYSTKVIQPNFVLFQLDMNDADPKAVQQDIMLAVLV